MKGIRNIFWILLITFGIITSDTLAMKQKTFTITEEPKEEAAAEKKAKIKAKLQRKKERKLKQQDAVEEEFNNIMLSIEPLHQAHIIDHILNMKPDSRQDFTSEGGEYLFTAKIAENKNISIQLPSEKTLPKDRKALEVLRKVLRKQEQQAQMQQAVAEQAAMRQQEMVSMQNWSKEGIPTQVAALRERLNELPEQIKTDNKSEFDEAKGLLSAAETSYKISLKQQSLAEEERNRKAAINAIRTAGKIISKLQVPPPPYIPATPPPSYEEATEQLRLQAQRNNCIEMLESFGILLGAKKEVFKNFINKFLPEDKINKQYIRNATAFINAVCIAFFKISILEQSDFEWTNPLRKFHSKNRALKVGLNSKEACNLRTDVFKKIYNSFKGNEENRRIPTINTNQTIAKTILSSPYLPERWRPGFLKRLFTRLIYTTEKAWWLKMVASPKPYNQELIKDYIKIMALSKELDQPAMQQPMDNINNNIQQLSQDKCVQELVKHKMEKIMANFLAKYEEKIAQALSNLD